MIRGKMSIKSIFTRLIITFLLILIPMYLLSVGIQIWGKAIIQKEIINSMSSQTDYYRINLANEFSRIQNLETECFSDIDLLKLSSIPQALNDFERAQLMNRLQSKMFSIKNSNIYIADAKVMIPSLGKSISANEGISSITESDLRTIQNFQDKYFLKLINENNTLYLCAVNTYYDILPSGPKFLIQVEFSNEMLQKSLITYNKYNDSGLMLICPSQQYIINTGSNHPIEDQIINEINESQEINFNNIFNVNGVNYLGFFSKLDYMDFWLSVYVPVNEVYSPLNIYRYLLWIFTFISICIIAVFSYSTHQFINQPLKNLVTAFHHVEAGDMKYFIKHKVNDEFQYLYRRFNAMLKYVNDLIDQVYTQKIMSQKAELKQLQSQINPHFLYNSFFIMQRMIQGDEKENAIEFCGYLGKYFQYVTRNAQDEISLSKELEHARNYSEIQKIRFSRIHIEFDELPDKYKDLIVPRLILQPIIENAFEHGFNKNVKEPTIHVHFIELADGLCINVDDNGSNVNDNDIEVFNIKLSHTNVTDQENTGLINVNKRIKLNFGENSGIKVSRSNMNGWSVSLTLIIHRGESICTDS